ncbi:MAG: universal stress protein, partial [Coriobacteriia bacterium]|nr:universal stress protein [Coriobacteriia bacterium]
MRILIPLDGSKVGEAAIPVIARLADSLAPGVKPEAILIGVITILRHWVVVGEATAPVSYTEEELRLIKKKVAEYLEKAGEPLRQKGIDVRIIVSTGNAADEILKAAEENKV